MSWEREGESNPRSSDINRKRMNYPIWCPVSSPPPPPPPRPSAWLIEGEQRTINKSGKADAGQRSRLCNAQGSLAVAELLQRPYGRQRVHVMQRKRGCCVCTGGKRGWCECTRTTHTWYSSTTIEYSATSSDVRPAHGESRMVALLSDCRKVRTAQASASILPGGKGC